MPIINRGKIPHVVFSYLTSAFMAGTETGQLKTYNKYRYASSINLVPILDKSSPFLCTVYLFDGEDAAVNKKQDVIKIGDMPKSTGFFIDNSFNEIDITHNFEASKGGFMTEVKKKILDTIQSFFKDDPAMAAASISAFKEVPGAMSFVNLFIDADKITDFSESFNRILANSQLRYPEEHIKVYNGSNIDVPNIVVKKHYISFDASNDPYEDLFKDIMTLKLLPTLFSPSSFEVVKNLLGGLNDALSGDDIKFNILETDVYQPLIEIASFLYYYTNMAAQAYIAADFHNWEYDGSDNLFLIKLSFSACYQEFQYFTKYDPSQCRKSGSPNLQLNRPSLGYCLVGLCLAPIKGGSGREHLGHNIGTSAYGGDSLSNSDYLVKNGILTAWFFGHLFRRENGYIPSSIQLVNRFGTIIYQIVYFPQISTDTILNIYYYTGLDILGKDKVNRFSGKTKELIENIIKKTLDDAGLSNTYNSRYNFNFWTASTFTYADQISKNISVNIDTLRTNIASLFGVSINDNCIFTTHAPFYIETRRTNAIPDFIFTNAEDFIFKKEDCSGSYTDIAYNVKNKVGKGELPAALYNLVNQYDGAMDEFIPIIPLIILGKEQELVSYAEKAKESWIDNKKMAEAIRICAQLMAYGAFLSYHTTLFKVAGIVQRVYSYVSISGKKPPKLLSSINEYGNGREPIGIMPMFVFDSMKSSGALEDIEKDIKESGFNKGILDQKAFDFIMLTLGTIIGGYSLPYDITNWHASVKYGQENAKVPNYEDRMYTIFGGLFYRTLDDHTFFQPKKVDSKTLVQKTFDLFSQTEMGKNIVSKMGSNINNMLSSSVVINYLKGTMIYVGLLFYYCARNLVLDVARSERDKLLQRGDRSVDKLGESKAVLYQAIMNDENELASFYNVLLDACAMYSLFGSVDKASHANKQDKVPWDKAKIGTEEDYNSDNHKLWIKVSDPLIQPKIKPYIEKMKKEKGFKKLINFATDESLGVSRFMFFFRPVDTASIGKSCTYAYYIYDCLYYFNIANVFGNKDGTDKIVFMNTRMETIARQKMNKQNDYRLISATGIDVKRGDGCPQETMFTHMTELYREIMNTYLQGGASATSAEGVQTSEGKVGGKTEGIKVKEEQGDLFLAKILNMFNVLLTLPPGNYHYVPYFKYLFKALLSGSTYVTINNVKYYISYYLIVLHNISALSRSSANTKADGTKVSSKSDSRVLAYLIPTNVQVKTSEVYTYPFDFQNELVNKNKARPLYTTLTIQFKPIEDLLYIYATHFTLDEIRRALALNAPDFGGTGISDDPCDTGKLETQEVNDPCHDPTPPPS